MERSNRHLPQQLHGPGSTTPLFQALFAVTKAHYIQVVFAFNDLHSLYRLLAGFISSRTAARAQAFISKTSFYQAQLESTHATILLYPLECPRPLSVSADSKLTSPQSDSWSREMGHQNTYTVRHPPSRVFLVEYGGNFGGGNLGEES